MEFKENMKAIDKMTYQLFLENGGECLWANDSRVPRPKGTSPETDEMFYILEAIDHRFKLIATGKYSARMINIFKKEIETFKPKISQEVFEIMRNKYL